MRKAHALFLWLAAALAILGPAPRTRAAAVGNMFTYQGKLDRSGVPANTTCNLKFTLFDALSGGSQVATITLLSQTLTNGFFTVSLDFGPGIFTGSARWMEIQVQCAGDAGYTLLTPREPLTAAPYALYALNNATGLVLPYTGNASTIGTHAFRVNNTATTGASIGIYGGSSSTDGAAIGVAGFSGTGHAIQGNSVSGVGVLGASASGAGVQGVSTSNRAVYGYSNNAEGVYGDSDTGNGVTGAHLVANSLGHGVLGTTNNGSSAGVYGSSTAGDGVFGYTTAANKAGVVGLANSAQARAGYFRNDGGGAGIYSEVTSATSIQGNSTIGIGVYGVSATNDGVFGQSSGSGKSGVTGVSYNANGQGGYFVSANGLGVYGISTTNDGIFGQSGGANKSGVVGVSYSASGQGGYFKNLGGGAGLWVDGTCKVRTLQILGGSDLAEPFDITSSEGGVPIEAGMVVVIDENHPGQLRVADQPFDARVAGVISGANGLEPGMVMRAHKHAHADGQYPVAMSGRVWCYADATMGAIRPGDRLTSSATLGHAMKADRAGEADGAVIGKAMTGLERGKGLVLVLVNLQ